ncbi:MAG: 1-acyl-sn-glycerol-3-phosphate acyltransferase [Caulobacter sp.]|nr:1-acyl-sn-glycerol-3-phosphate acyltransferase [Caulobacter sp.]
MGEKHIVDVLIEERAPKLAGSPIWPVVRPPLYRALHYPQAVAMAEAIAPMGGADALAYISDLLALETTVRGIEHLPVTGRLIVVANHPTGIADGIALYDVLKGPRPDVVFYANSDAHRVCPRFDEALIPVEWVKAKRSRERTRLTLQMTREAMEADRCLAIFPAGVLSRRDAQGVLTDKPWMPTAISVAQKYAAPVTPVHVSGPWSTLFHFFNGFSPELRDITLFHELLNKTGRKFALTVGRTIPPARLEGDSGEVSEALKQFVEQVLQNDPEAVF